MSVRSALRVLPLGLVLFAAACSDATGPAAELSAAEAEAVALFLAEADGSGAFLVSPEGPNPSHTFERSRPCPAGGTHETSGTRARSLDPETRTLTSTWSTTQTHEACASTRRRGGVEVTVVIDGSVTAQGSATHQLPEVPGPGRELLAFENVRTGLTTTTVGDRSRTCEIAITERYDPDTDTFTVEGTVCGRTVSVTRDRPSRPFGG